MHCFCHSPKQQKYWLTKNANFAYKKKLLLTAPWRRQDSRYAQQGFFGERTEDWAQHGSDPRPESLPGRSTQETSLWGVRGGWIRLPSMWRGRRLHPSRGSTSGNETVSIFHERRKYTYSWEGWVMGSRLECLWASQISMRQCSTKN